MKSPIQLFIAIAILLATATVAAQVYKWVDKDGKVQYTDTPPPPGATKAEPKKVDTPNSGVTTPPPAAKSLQDRSKDFDKRRADATEKEKKDAEAQKKAASDGEECKAAKNALIDLEGGRPINRANEKGERVYLSDDDRQAETARARAVVTASCKE